MGNVMQLWTIRTSVGGLLRESFSILNKFTFFHIRHCSLHVTQNNSSSYLGNQAISKPEGTGQHAADSKAERWTGVFSLAQLRE